jgi:26S proteasome regulatory subunit N7
MALEKTPGLCSKIGIVLTLVRVGFFFADFKHITTHLSKAEKSVLSTYPPLLPLFYY